MNAFAISGLLIFITSAAMGIFVFLKAYRNIMNILWALFTFSVAIWGIGVFKIATTDKYNEAMYWWKFSHIGIILIPILFLHFVYEFLKERNRRLIFLGYLAGCCFLISLFYGHLIRRLEWVFDSFYYDGRPPTFTYILFVIFWVATIIHTHMKLLNKLRQSNNIKKNQIKYFFVSTLLGYLGGMTCFLPVFGINLYPYGNFIVPLYPIIMTYAIIKYQLMDIKVAVTRAGIFLIVYASVLGIPFLVGHIYHDRWIIPTGLAVILATLGPFIYLFLQRKTERHILQEEARAQRLLVDASYGMTNIRNLKKLLRFIVNILIESLGLDNAVIYLKSFEKGGFILKAVAHRKKCPVRIKEDSFLVTKILKDRSPIVFEEMKLLLDAQGSSASSELKGFVKEADELGAHVVIPVISEEALLGLILLGERQDRSIYSTDLINVLSVLGNQAALAIENCIYFEAEAKRIEEKGFQERIASLDMMASSFAHEIDNPNSIIINQAEYLRERLTNDPAVLIPDELRQEFNKTIDYIVDSSKRVSGMVESILEYSRLGTGKLKPLKINDAVASFLTLIGPRLKNEQVDFIVDVEENLPFILGDKVQIEEIFMNFMTNALHAVKDRKDKRIRIKVFRKNEDVICIQFSDNGYGIPKKMIKDIFLASVTTKGSSEGTGLGLYHVRKIVARHRGNVWAQSAGVGKGAIFIVELPVHKGDFRDALDKEGRVRGGDTRKVF